MIFNSWEHLYPSLDAVEVGAGKFCIMRNLSPITPSFVLVMPSYGMRQTASSGDQYPRGIELKVHILRHQMERPEKDSEWLRYVSV